MLVRKLLEGKLQKVSFVIVIIISMFLTSFNIAQASTTVEPTADQYLELRAVEVKDVAGANKQVIMELWGYNLEFKRI